MKYVGPILVGVVTAIISSVMGYSIVDWEHWAIFGSGMAMYLMIRGALS